MMKKILSIALCGALLLSCVPAIAASNTTTSVEPSLADMENVYTVDLSGDTPVLKFNGEAIVDSAPDDAENNPPTLTNRGHVTVVADTHSGKDERVARLENLATDVTGLATEFGQDLAALKSGNTQGRYRFVDSALMVDMGAGAQAKTLTGNVVIKFKVYDPYKVAGGSTVDGITAGGYGRIHAPLVLSDQRMGNYNHDPYFLLTRRDGTSQTTDLYVTGNAGSVSGGIVPNAGNYTDMISNAPTWYQIWNDYTVLYDTTNNNFKLWINGVQYKKADGSEWFLDAWHGLNGGIQDIIFSTWLYLNAETDASNNGFMYFKDMAFGSLKSVSATAEWTPVNEYELNFDGYAQDRAGQAAGNIKLYADSSASVSGAEAQVDPTTYINASYSATTDKTAYVKHEAVVPPVANPNANYAGNKAWRLWNDNLSNSNAGNSWHGYNLTLTKYVDGTKVNWTEPTAVEFDFMNATTDGTLRAVPFMIYSGGNGGRTRYFLGFDGEGVWVCFKDMESGQSGAPVKVISEDTRNKWYNIKYVVDPDSNMMKLWINGEEIINPENDSNRLVKHSEIALSEIYFGTGKALTEASGSYAAGVRDYYFDNIKIYEFDNNLVVSGEDIAVDDAANTVTFTANIDNNLGDAATAVPVIGLYSGNNLKALKIGTAVTVADGAEGTATATVSMAGLSGTLTAKAFIWQTSFASMNPFDALSYFGSSCDNMVFKAWNITPSAE